MDRDHLLVERALGLQWCVQTDTFNFKTVCKERMHSRHGVLSVISSISEPLGYLAPLTLLVRLYKLNPILEDALFRVGCWLCKIEMPEDVKHPVILSKDQHISKLILKHIHKPIGHGGRSHILSKLRRKYWITHATAAARRILLSCVYFR